MQYEPNPKHKHVPSPGRHGSICPRGLDPTPLLLASSLVGKKRYATDGDQPYCAQCHDREHDLWHGYPVAWSEVPPIVVSQWMNDGLVTKRTIRTARRSRQ